MPQSKHRNADGEVDYHCPRGHHVHGQNVENRTNGKGHSYPNCRTCRQEYRRDYRNRPEVLAKKRAKRNERLASRNKTVPVYALSGRQLSDEEYMGTKEKRSSPWNALRPRPEASLAFDEFNAALKFSDVPCRGRAAEYTEFQDPRGWVDDNEGRLPMPSAGEARDLCKACPLAELCGAYAEADKPDFGVFNGQRWVGSKVLP